MKKSPRERVRSALLIAALTVMAVSGVNLYREYKTGNQEQEQYNDLKEAVVQTTAAIESQPAAAEESTEAPYVSPVNFDELKKINPDVVGWITIPGTKIDYPIVYTDNNDKYLHTSFEGEESVAGTVYVDFESEPDFSGQHTLIYGHNMKNGTMFKDIVKYKDEEYFKEHQDIYIYTPEREIHLKAMAALYTDPGPLRRVTKFPNEEGFAAYIEQMTKDCTFRQIPEGGIDRLYSLVTCSYEFNDARTILYAYEAEAE